MYYILERGGEKIMKKRWFVVILTIGLLLHVLPLSVLALSPDPTITDSDGTLLGWSDLSTVSDVLDDSREQQLAVVDADNDEEAADDRSAGNLTPKTLDEESGDEESDDEESDDDDPADDDDSTTTPAVCKIDKIDDTYYYSTLDEAISKAMPGDQIDLLTDIELNTGLTFDNKTLTISGGGTYTLTLKELGMHATNDSEITFKDLTLIINAHTNPSGAGATANLIYSSKLRLSHVEFKLTPDRLSGSGICLYNGSDLYFEDNTNAVIDGFSADSCSGIYADTDTYSEDEIHEVRVSSSTLTVTNSGWNGMTINPVNLNLTNSHVTLNNNGKGGLGCYYGS